MKANGGVNSEPRPERLVEGLEDRGLRDNQPNELAGRAATGSQVIRFLDFL